MNRIVVCNSSSFGRRFPEHLKRLARLGRVRRVEVGPRVTGAGLARALGPCRAIVASVAPRYDAAFFRARPEVALIARHGIGVNNVDLEAATRCGVLVTRVAGVVEREAMAEHTLALLLSVLRRLNDADWAVRNGRWRDRASFIGSELQGATAGVIGCGNIGSRVVRILALGFGARVLVCDPFVSAAVIRRAGGAKAPLAALLQSASVVTLHCPLTPETRGLIGRHALGRMRRGAILVNTARGELLDERAVAAALKAGRLGGLATDVVAAEPAGPRHPFLTCENALVVPHIGAYTGESLRVMGESVTRAVESTLRGRRPAGLINPQVWRSPALRIRLRR